MSGVRNFVRGTRDEEQRQTPQSPRATQIQTQQRHGRVDRSSAARLKVKRGEKTTGISQMLGQQLPTAPGQGFQPNPNFTDTQNTLPKLQYEPFENQPAPLIRGRPDPRFVVPQLEELSIQGGTFDDTITSGFEDTKSDLNFNGGPRSVDNHGEGILGEVGYGRQDEELQDRYINQDPHQCVESTGRSSPHFNQHGLQHKQGRSPLMDAGTEQKLNAYGGYLKQSISGRFQRHAGDRWQQDIPHHNGVILGSRVYASNKRDRDDELECVEDVDQATYDQQCGLGLGESEEEDCEDESLGKGVELPDPRDDGNHHHEEQESGHAGIGPCGEGAETAYSAVSRRQARRHELDRVLQARNKDGSQFKLDHNDEALQGLAYADLQRETWDGGKPTSQKHAAPIRTQTEFMPEDYFIHMVHEEDIDSQVKYFQEMSIEEYEQVGDFFIEKFSDLMNQIKDARKKKRDMVAKFEGEIEEREKAVRSKSGFLEQKFEAMRAGGEGVLNVKV